MSPSGAPSANTTTAALAGTGALAGAIPDSSHYRQNTQSNQDVTSTYNTGDYTDMTTLMNWLSQMMSQTTGTSDTQFNQSTTPTLSPEATAYMNSLMQKFQGMTTPSLTGYSGYQTSNINANSDAQRQAVGNIMASRGLTGSPAAAAAEANIEQNRINQITGMQQQLPLLQNQLNLANLGAAANYFAMLPRGQQTTGSQQQQTAQTTNQQSSGSQNQNVSGQVLHSGHTNTQTANMGLTSGYSSSGGGIPGAIAGGAQGAAQGIGMAAMASDKRLKKFIRDISQSEAIDKVRELKAKSWEWKGTPGGKETGVVAQDIEKILPGLVKDSGVGFKAVDYVGLIPYLIGAVQNIDSRLVEAEA